MVVPGAPGLRTAAAFRYLNYELDQCFLIFTRREKVESDARRLIEEIRRKMGEPEPVRLFGKDGRPKGKGYAPVIEVRFRKRQRRSDRLRFAIVARIVEGDDEPEGDPPGPPPTDTAAPRPRTLVTA